MLIEKIRAGEFILSEANGTRSRTEGTLAQHAAGIVPAGSLLGIVSGKYVPYSNAASDGSATTAAVLYAPTDATGGDAPCVVIDCDAELIASMLTGLDDAAKADLKALGIKLR